MTGKATFLDLRMLHGLNRTLLRFDVKLKVIREGKKQEVFDWLEKWTPRRHR